MSNGYERLRKVLVGMLVALGMAATGLGVAQRSANAGDGSWEMRVCADPGTLPFSNRQEEGFENRIAEIIADELGANLTYDWFPQGPDMITFRLRAGHCDLIIGVPDSSDGLLTTVTYYRSPYVFVYRKDSGFEVETFDDEILHELEIALQNVGIPPHEALLNRGLDENIVDDYLEGEPRLGAGRSRAVMDAVVEGEVDLALVWGPVAGYFAGQADAELVVRPVQPQFEPPFITQSFPMTMGVRLGDDALRDLLDVAIANRWDDIQQVLANYDVVVQQSPQPVLGTLTDDAISIGFLSPTVTGSSAIPESLYDIAGQAARNGVMLAESSFTGGTAEEAPVLDVLPSSVPTAEAARRAAERMVTNGKVRAFIGGIGEGQAEVIAEVAQEAEIPFFNVGSPFMRRECTGGVFHVEASGAMYVSAIASWHAGLGQQDWYVIHDDGDDWTALAEWSQAAIEGLPDSDVVGVVEVPQGKPSYHQEFREIGESGADAVLLLLGPRDQLAFLAQFSTSGLDLPVATFPGPVTQTREFLAAGLYRAQNAAAGYHVLLWETTLEEGSAGELNGDYMSRFGDPMDPSAWAAYQSLAIFQQAVAATGGTSLEALTDHLTADGTTFEVAKGVATFFDESHQLRQPLYVVEVSPEGRWGHLLSTRVAIATLAGQIPTARELDANPAAALLAMGSSDGSACR